MAEGDHLAVDGVSLDDLLPPPTSRQKRKEPNTILDAEHTLIEGMARPLPPSNIGYQMMAKMGFKASQMTQQPLEIELRKGRGGLGSFESQRAMQEEKEAETELIESKRRKEFDEEAEKMQIRLRMQAAAQKMTANLFSMLKLAMHLREDKTTPRQSALTASGHIVDDPPPLLRNTDVISHFHNPNGMTELRQLLSSMQLNSQQVHQEQLNRYLREDFLYCFYCAHSFESQEALQKMCPGPTEESHLNATMPAP